MPEEKTISSDLVFDGERLKLKVDKVRMPSGRESRREVVVSGDAVVVVPVDSQGNLLLVRQYRYAAGKELLELPAGGIDGDEKPEEAVYREMQEETGYRPDKMERLGGYYSAPGLLTEYLYLFLASGLTESKLEADDTEMIRVERYRPEEISGLISSGEIEDAKSVAGLLFYLNSRKTGRNEKAA